MSLQEQITQLEGAITQLEAQRATLGDAAVDVAQSALRQQALALRQAATAGGPPPLVGEFKHVTIMFANISGFAGPSRTTDSESVRDLMNACFTHLVPIVEKYGGTVDKFIGEEIMALFGAPVVHEDDPERALRAALEMADALAEFNAEWGADLGGRFGINTGLVVAGNVGAHGRQEYSVMGDAVNLASRLKEISNWEEILVGPDTYRLAAPLFDFEALAPVRVKGKIEPVPLYRLLAARSIPGRPRDIVGLTSSLVGRRTELAALQDAIERLQAGEGGVVTVVGEAGLGKSRLTAEIRNSQFDPTAVVGTQPDRSGRHLLWLEGRCLSYGTSIAYHLWVDVLRGLLEVTTEDTPVAVRNALRGRIQALCPHHFDTIYPYLGWLMSLPLEAEIEAMVQNLEGESLKLGVFRAASTLIEHTAQQWPLIVVCEDLHWADPTSIELLEQLLTLTLRMPLLLLCVFRPGHSCRRIREIAAQFDHHHYTDLRLVPLSAAESETLLGNLLHHVQGLPHKLKWRILSHTEGNPLYVEEILRSLIDDQTIVQDEITGHWEMSLDIADIPIPDTLHGVLMARIDRLPEDAKRVLQMAAVVGRIFSYRVLATIVATWIADKPADERALEKYLSILQQGGMIRERAREPELEYIFKHQLTQEAAYNGLLKKDRRVYHRHVAETLEQLFADRIDEQVEMLAHHWEQAGETAKAVDYLFQAGDRARRLVASKEAIEFYRLALHKVQASENNVELGRIHERLGDVYLMHLSRHSQALEHYSSFLALARLEEDVARGARKVAAAHLLRGELAQAQEYYETALARLSSLPPLAETSRVLYGLAYLFILKNRLDDAVRHASGSLEISRQIGDTRGLADAYRIIGNVASQRGSLQVACEYDEKCIELYRELGDLPRLARACNNLGDSYRLLGQMDRAMEYLDEGLALSRRIGSARDEAMLLQTLSELFLDQGRSEQAITHLEQALPLAQACGAPVRMIETHRILGSACERVGRLDDARHHLEIAETLSLETQHLRFTARICLGMACLHVTSSEFDKAMIYIQLASDAAGPEPSQVFRGLLYHCHGYLHSRRRNWDDAVAHLEKSLQLLEQANLPVKVAQTRHSLGVAYANRDQKGDRGRACEQLSAALSLFRQIKAHTYLAQVQAQLDELGYQS